MKKSKIHTVHDNSAINLLNHIFNLMKFDFTSLNEQVLKGFSQSFNDNTFISTYLNEIRHQWVLISNDDQVKILEKLPDAQNIITPASAFFSLLPDELIINSSEDSIFDYFFTHVDRTTATLWTLWLQNRPYYSSSSYPVFSITPDKNIISENQKVLIAHFKKALLETLAPHDESSKIEETIRSTVLNCWLLLCNKTQFSESVLSDFLPASPSEFQITSDLFDYVHPAILHVSLSTIENFIQRLISISKDFKIDNLTKYLFFIFVIITSKIGSNLGIIIDLSMLLCGWLPSLYNSASPVFEICLDTFNFVMCSCSSQDESFQNPLYDRLKDLLKALPKKVFDLIILNEPKQSFQEPKKLLYEDFEYAIQRPKSPKSSPLNTEEQVNESFQMDDFMFDTWF